MKNEEVPLRLRSNTDDSLAILLLAIYFPPCRVLYLFRNVLFECPYIRYAEPVHFNDLQFPFIISLANFNELTSTIPLIEIHARLPASM